jgi:hypothetical protein
MNLHNLLDLLELVAFVAMFILFLGNAQKREQFKNGILAIGRVLESRLAKNIITLLLGTATLLILLLAFMTGFLKISDGQIALGISLSMVMTICAIGYALCNYRLFFK